MKLYKQEDRDIILAMQNKDPFFDFLTLKTMKTIRNRTPGKLLDLGCGSGRIVIEAAKNGWTALGIDSSNKAVDNGRAYARKLGVSGSAEFQLGDIMKADPKKLGTFDVVCMQEVIEHIPNYHVVVDIAYRCLRPGGLLILTTPHDPSQWTVLDDYAEHVQRFRIPTVRSALSRFRTVRIGTVGFPLHRLSLKAYDILMRGMKKEHKARYFRQSTLVRYAYYAVGWTLLRIDALFSFLPWGTTIWAVAEK